MKNLSLLIVAAFCALQSTNTLAQNTHLNTPIDADIIFTLRGENILTKLSLDEMREFPYLNKILTDMSKMVDSENEKIENLGIDLSSSAEYFMKFQDGGQLIMGMSLKVNDATKYVKNFLDGSTDVENGITYTISDGYTRALKGNEGLIIYSVMAPIYEDSFYYGDDVYYDYDYDEEAIEESPEYEIEEEAEESYQELDEEIEENVEEVFDYDAYYENLAREEEEKRQAEEDSVANVSKEYAFNLLLNENVSLKGMSVSNVSIDNNADFSIHMADYASAMKYINQMNSSGYNYDPFGFNEIQNKIESSVYGGMNWITGNGYFLKDEIKLEMFSKSSDELATINRSMFDREFNPEMLKYIPFDDQLAYAAVSANTENIINSYYDLIGIIGEGASEDDKEMAAGIDLFVDFLKLYTDEAAINNLFKGDFYFGVTDLNSYEIEYTSYEYDDDWNSIEVQKTKEEIRPDFLCMFSSEEYELMDKVFKYISITTDGLFEDLGGYYKLSASNEVPLDIYCMHKNGVVFIFTSDGMFKTVNKGGKKPSASQAENIVKNSWILEMDAGKFFQKFPLTDLSEQEQKMITYSRENLGSVKFLQEKIEGNILKQSFTMNVAGDYSNSLEYLLSLMNEMGKIEDDFNNY